MRSRIAATLAAGLLATGCYTLRPAPGVQPSIGKKVAFDVNDAGRVALGGSMGPEIAQIEGLLLQKDAEGYLLKVSAVRTIHGAEQPWSGEQVRLKPEYLGQSYEKKLSVGRTLVFGLSVAGGFVLIATQSILGSGTSDKPAPGDSANTRIGRP